MRAYLILYAALALVVLANATNIMWKPHIIQVINTLPSPRNTSFYETTLSKIAPLDPNFTWRGEHVFDCKLESNLTLFDMLSS